MSAQIVQVQTYLAQAEARDKTARAVQYAARAIVGACAYLLERKYVVNSETAKRVQTFQTKARNVLSSLSDARRTNRWGKELTVIPKLPDIAHKIPTDRVEFLNLVSKSILIIFFMRDHFAWLCSVKMINIEPKKVIRSNLRWYVVSHTLQALYQLLVAGRFLADRIAKERVLSDIRMQKIQKRLPVAGRERTATADERGGASSGGASPHSAPRGTAGGRGASRPEPKPALGGEDSGTATAETAPQAATLAALKVLKDRVSKEEEELEKKIAKLQPQVHEALLQAFKSILLCFQGLHNSQWYLLHDLPVGLLGVITASIDMYKLWPPRPNTYPPDACR